MVHMMLWLTNGIKYNMVIRDLDIPNIWIYIWAL